MKRFVNSALVVLIVVAIPACSKKEKAATPAAESIPVVETNPSSGTQPAREPAAANFNQWEQNVSTALQQQNYQAAVDNLAQLSAAQRSLSDAQKVQYAQQLQRTLDALARAKETDPQAKAAYERLGRAAVGR